MPALTFHFLPVFLLLTILLFILLLLLHRLEHYSRALGETRNVIIILLLSPSSSPPLSLPPFPLSSRVAPPRPLEPRPAMVEIVLCAVRGSKVKLSE